ncbi:Gypsy retrotransposon integrase-like protein 1 [Didymosphaeria variabile]|uniref:Gypsy retrotransposon integrase-like protein 1 n=1 Tax=Didymosphaeria variabile TaxID=1932322 RepID=A0A9W8XW69_9PLEO|nr:Gypsy retrotransposon integrase-like protein 1 [Didymosphaeria variabile]KAJ4360834.1 Gypsy retrotransposon integrase-like protein 1 [Didymosphaeria variabile]
MDASTSPVVDVQAADAARDAAVQFEDTPDGDDQTSPINDDSEEQPHRTATGPMQKRRRVTRACDECRRKKIKCDGKQPCTHCTVYSYECTYDQPSNRRRTAAPQYIEALESQLKRAKTILSIVFPTLDIGDASIDAHLQSGMLPQFPAAPARPQPFQEPRSAPRRDDPARVEDTTDSHLESMVKATGNLDLDEDGNWDYHGQSSGLSFMRRIQQEYGDIISGKAPSASLFKYRPPSQVLDSPNSAHPSPADSTALPAGTDLPPKKIARTLCDSALIDASAMLRVVHLPSFYKSLDRIYEITPENYGNAENTFLPLLYAVLALGTLFPKVSSAAELAGVEGYADEGYKYFRTSRQLLDVTDCRDSTSLQAIVFMIQFLQSTAKLSTCYSYIGVALRSAIRMGMHRSFNINFTPIEAETRKRLFWAIWRMDTYVGAMLGLPHFIEDEDVDQDYPTEVDDEYITETEILPMPEGKISIMHASNAHVKIVRILSKLCQYVYPTKGTQNGGKHSVTYSVSYSKIREIEQSMQRWLDELPMALKPGGEAPPIILRVQQLLRMAFAHAQLLLYRPFLHYVSSTERSKASVDQRAFASEMKKRGLLVGAYWFSMYSTFFSIISILYFVLENPTSQTSRELFREVVEGKELLDYFAKQSLAADRCAETLQSIFDRLPEVVKRGGLNVDINTLMFPSADPLAYPNQPMTTFENNHPQAYQFKHGSPNMAQLPPQYTGVDIKPSPATYTSSPLANVPPGSRRPDNEVQLLGPMPMYLMQGAQHRSFHPQTNVHGPSPQIPGQNPTNLSFDEIFGGEEWAQTFMDPGLGLSGGHGYGVPPHYGAGGPNMGGW